MKLALVQTNPIIGDLSQNTAALLARVREAASAGADLAVCPELCICGYPPRDLLEQPWFIDANLRALEQFAAGAAIPAVAGFVNRTPDGRLQNAAALVARGRVLSVHAKSLLPTYDVFDEWRYFEPATERRVAELDGVKLGISICEDIWNDADFWPERRYRIDPVAELADLGARILINISASPYAVEKRALRPRMLAAQAKKHGLPLVLVNQVGGNDDLVFDGASMVFSADGTLAARAREFSDDLAYADVDPDTGHARGDLAPSHGHDARGDCAAALDALVLGTRDYLHKCGFQSALVGLSGGIDSALTAAIAARALGPQNVHGVSMPSRYSSEHSKDDALALASALGIHYTTVPIEAMFQAATDSLSRAQGPAFAAGGPGVTEENIQARCRGMILMALSNKFGHMVLTTGNKSELAVGYCTLYGDMCGGLAVLSDVPKTLVYALSRELNRQEGRDVIPRSTLVKPPSAELRPDQTDQDSLPPYEVLDAILEHLIEAHLDREQIIARGFDPAVVDRVIALVRQSEYKRSQAPPGLKIRSKSFGPGRRMPLAARWS